MKRSCLNPKCMYTRGGLRERSWGGGGGGVGWFRRTLFESKFHFRGKFWINLINS